MAASEQIAGGLRDRMVMWFGEVGTAMMRTLPAETAHDLAMFALRRGLMNVLPAPHQHLIPAGLRVNLPGVGGLEHPIGLAAGFDKNARCPHAFAKMGFSFLEIGTVTPRPQAGNPKPRMFRYPEQRALINRMGFNSDGANAVADRLKSYNWNHETTPLGVNLGKNKATPPERAIDDYLQVLEACRPSGQYYVVNISSPNTPGLRDLATPEFLGLVADLFGADIHKTYVKIDPDMDKKGFQELVAAAVDRGFLGLILSNTHRVVWPEVGGQSGHPLTSASNRCLELAHEVHNGKMPMIASGGILTGADVFQKLIRGASAVQIYTALVYRGPWAVLQMLEELTEELKLNDFACAEDAIGSLYRE